MISLADEPATTQQRAREIMGRNFFGVEDAFKHFGINPTRPQLATLLEIPFYEEVLEQSKDTHVLVAVFPLSILEIREITNHNFFLAHDWYDQHYFAKDKGATGWQLVCKTELSGSINKTWREQQSLLDKDNNTPPAQVLAYTIIGHYLATGGRLFEDIYVRTASSYSNDYRAYIGVFSSAGLHIFHCWDNSRCARIGVASARRSS